jgi:hypothetical protein
MIETTDDLKAAMNRATMDVPEVRDLAMAARRRSIQRNIGATGAGVAVVLLAVAVAVVGGGLLSHRAASTVPASGLGSPTVDAPAQALLPDLTQLGETRPGSLMTSKADIGPAGASVTFTVPDYDVGYAVACQSPEGGNVRGSASLIANGAVIGEASRLSCNSGFPDSVVPINSLRTWGDRPTPGKSLTLQWRPDDPNGFDADTVWMIALYRPIPLDAFAFPSAPDQLQTLRPLPLTGVGGGQGSTTDSAQLLVQGHNTDAETTTYSHVRVYDGLRIFTEMVAPGQLTIKADGTTVAVDRAWDYDGTAKSQWLSPQQLGIRPGDNVTLTISTWRLPSNTADWTVYDEPNTDLR